MDDKLTRSEQEAQFMEAMASLSFNDQADIQQLMEWLAQRPKDAEPLTHEKLDELFQDVRRENTRRRLDGRVGVILPFKRPDGKKS